MKKPSAEPRKKIPATIETQVLVESRRRCCLCFHLNGDLGQKQGQIAHLDKVRTNNTEANLAFLCLPHHDEYDSRTSQSKGITKDELQYAKDGLRAYLKESFASDTVHISITIKGDLDRLSEAQQHELLKQVLAAAKVKNSVRVQSVSRGSVVFRLIATADDAAAIFEAFNSGRLVEAGVMNVDQVQAPLKDVSFAEAFSRYSHGMDKREVARTVLAPDSAAFFDGPQTTTPDRAAFGLYLRRVTERYSLLVIADQTKEVCAAFPIAHNELPLEAGAGPYQALSQLVDRFGVPLRLDGSQAKLRVGERVHLPHSMSNEEIVRFLESRAAEAEGGGSGPDYELVCLMEQGGVLSDYRLLHLLFALSKPKYFESLAGVGLRIRGGRLGRFISARPRG